MNILIINHYAGSDKMGMVFRTYYFAKEWVKMGHQVAIVAADYSHLRQVNPEVTEDLQHECIDGINYYWIIAGEYHGNGVNRALSMVRFSGKLLKYKNEIIKRTSPDIVIATSVYQFDSYPSKKIADKAHAKYIHEVRDMWPITLMELSNMSSRHPFVMAVQTFENYAYKHADAVVSLLKNAQSYMMQHGLKPGKFYYVPNGVLKEEWEAQNIEALDSGKSQQIAEFRSRFHNIVGFFGSVNITYGLEELIEAADILRKEDLGFIIVGDGRSKDDLKAKAEKLELNNILFIDKIPKKQIPNLLEQFDFIYVGSKKNELFRFGISMNKMFDSMMGGKPIIFAVDTGSTPVSDSGCGICVPAEDIQGIVGAIQKLLKMDSEERHQMGMKGRSEILANYTYDVLAKRYIDIMKKI